MSVLSYQDIIRELGKGILFHPLKAGSIKACDLCLTASEYAYAIGQEQRLIIQTEQKKDRPGEEQKFFEIPKGETALVWTDEAVYLSNQFRGPLYSVVKQVSEGLGHIGTRVNPDWTGVLCIALHNVSDKAVRIYVKDVENPIAHLAIEKLSSKPSNITHRSSDARLDVLRGRPNSQEITDYFNQKQNTWMKRDTEILKKLMLESDEYKKLRKGFKDTLIGFFGSSEDTRWNRVSIIGAILIGGLSALFSGLTYFNSSHQAPTPNQIPTNTTVTPSSTK
ncbi:hypothetical protein [Nostoc sp. ChiQUE01b]|uniref:hypothetical protein n=1 Tax=Nostoc sp. ChiQUE01b TaxID=3075376 RepID=UPI002AD35934|nr:hypothetical protein [Nostoc sp. ChiQUE01b]MDZ8258353.1 hypothetical protein [Nostoc sp. ChiQUE01b]